MNKGIKAILSIGALILLILIGETIWRYIDEDYSNKVKLQTWETRLTQFLKQESEIPLNEKLESASIKNANTLTCDTIYTFGEFMPSYIGGEQAFIKYNFDHLSQIIKSSNESGITKLIYTITIGSDGTIIGYEILTTLNEKIMQRIGQIIMTMPKWQPGRVNGIPACFDITIPINCVNWK